MTEGDAPVQWSETDATPRFQLEDMTMLKKTLITAAALASLALFAAPQAEAGYKHGHGWKYGGGCIYLTKPVTVRVWSHYKHRFIWKTVYRDYPFCF
jgi:hypothetical protein